MEKVCEACEKRSECRTPCKTVNAILWHENRVMERHFGDHIVCYPMHGEVHFSELKDHQLDQFSIDDVIPWSSEDRKLRKTTVFIERFFHNVPCRELAERFGVKENTIVCMFKQAVESVEKIIEALDSRREGLKATKSGRFTDDQKLFLLVGIFGFSQTEVARMFNRDRDMVNQKVKRMSDRYGALFSGENKQESPIDDLPMSAKLTRADVVAMVEAYTEQGLSHRQAFKRIADRQGEVIGRPVKLRAVESRYYKAMAAEQRKEPVKSFYAGMTASEITERMAL